MFLRHVRFFLGQSYLQTRLIEIYPRVLDKKATENDKTTSYLHILFSSDESGHLNTLLYDKHVDFNFYVTYFFLE